MKHLKGLALAAAAAALLAMPYPAAAAGSTPMAAINQAVIDFNKGDYNGWAAACASPSQIIDDFPPHVWSGPTACSDWVTSFQAFVKKSKMTSMTVILGTPWKMAIAGNVAYVVLPVTFHFNQNGKPMKLLGSVMTIALKKSAGGWLMTGWAWADGH